MYGSYAKYVMGAAVDDSALHAIFENDLAVGTEDIVWTVQEPTCVTRVGCRVDELFACTTVPTQVYFIRKARHDLNIAAAHDGANNLAYLSDGGEAWTVDEWKGYYVFNLTDYSYGKITANTATTITATLASGTDNDWDTGDVYMIGTLLGIVTIPLTAALAHIYYKDVDNSLITEIGRGAGDVYAGERIIMTVKVPGDGGAGHGHFRPYICYHPMAEVVGNQTYLHKSA